MTTQILLVTSKLLVIVFVILVARKIINDKRVNRIWHTLETEPSHNSFTEDMVSELPVPVQRYFLHAIALGTPLANSVKLKMTGSLRTGKDKPWLPIQAKQIISALKGFVWKATSSNRFLKLMGADYYAGGSGRTQFCLWGIIPVVNARGRDIDRSAIGRFVGESIWLPSALLPQRGVSWLAIDNNTIQAAANVDGEAIILTLFINPDGKVLKIYLPRWGNYTDDGSYKYITFGVKCEEECTIAGFTIPCQISAGWWFDTEKYFNFFRVKIDAAEFC